MAFDNFRRYDSSRPKYRYFPNRTPKQTRIISYTFITINSFFLFFLFNFFNYKQNTINQYFNNNKYKYLYTHAHAQVAAQNSRLLDIFYKARRSALGLNKQPKLPLIIEEEEEEKE